MGRDCGNACPYVSTAPCSLEGAAVWAAGAACVRLGMATLEVDMSAALAMARESGASGWSAAHMLAEFAAGMMAGAEQRQSNLTPADGEHSHG